jgi:hypothetical protein
MLVKTSELTGAALNWSVRYAERGSEPKDYVEVRDNFSTCWNKGGPIIQREKISMRHDYWENGGCKAFIDRGGSQKNIIAPMYGSTPLIAAKFGDAVEIPDDLMV